MLIRPYNSSQGENAQNALSYFFANFCWRNKTILLISNILIEISQALQEFKFEMGGLWTVVNQESWVLFSFTHVQGSEIQTTFSASALFKHDRKWLLYTSRGDIDEFRPVFLTLYVDLDLLVDNLSKSPCQADTTLNGFVWLYLKT